MQIRNLRESLATIKNNKMKKFLTLLTVLLTVHCLYAQVADKVFHRNWKNANQGLNFAGFIESQ